MESLDFQKMRQREPEDWSSNKSLQATPVGAGLVALSRRPGVPELGRLTARIMSYRHFTKYLAWWIYIWVVVGAISGIGMSLIDGSGHLGFLGIVLICSGIGGLFGFIGGVIFAPVFAFVGSRLSTRSSRSGVAALVGSLSGLAGAAVANETLVLPYAVAVGGFAGAATGLLCEALTVSATGHRKNAV